YTRDVTLSDGVTLSADGSQLIVPAGVTHFTVTVPTVGDGLVEQDETFTLTVGGKSGIATIIDDDVAPHVGIDLHPIMVGGDNLVNQAEVAGKSPVTLSGTVSGDAKVGDTVTLTLADQSTLTTQVVDLGGGQLGFSTSTTADKLVDSQSVKAEITVTDAAGNSTTQEDSEGYTVDTVAPMLGIDLHPIVVGGDNQVNQAEVAGKTPVILSGTVSGDAKVGDTVILTLGDQSTLTTQVVDLGGGQLGFSASTTADKLVDSQSVKAEITVTDVAGNHTTATDFEGYSVDTTATGAPTVVITEDADNDGVISRSELSGQVNVEVSLPAEAKAGDTL
ncbi:Ig-like domain-containing protein, partial [Aeromonas diversa]|uniref:Ig-like domain-containing protein n=1 Tax=Aeromonas diversa TaxID=502790 RepID=UPI0039A12292